MKIQVWLGYGKESPGSPGHHGSLGWSVSPVNQKVTTSIPGQGTCLGCRFAPLGTYERQLIDVSLLLSPFLPLPLKSISMSLSEDGGKKREERKKKAQETFFFQGNKLPWGTKRNQSETLRCTFWGQILGWIYLATCFSCLEILLPGV